MSGGELFKVETVWNEADKRRDRVMVAVCGKCGRRSTVADTAGKAKPPVFFAQKFRGKGWRIGGRPNAHECPHCVGGVKPKAPRELTLGQRRAAFCRIADVPRGADFTASEQPKGADMTKPKTPPALVVVADPPRQPTREDLRKILDALDDCYLVDRGCYAKDGSDEALAARLNMPRAWVAAERERVFGPDANEEDGADLKAIPALVERADALEAQAMTLAEQAEALRMDVRRLEGRLAKRGVA